MRRSMRSKGEKADHDVESPKTSADTHVTREWRRADSRRQQKQLNCQQHYECAVNGKDGSFRRVRKDVVAVGKYGHPNKNDIIELSAYEADRNPDQHDPPAK